MAFSVVVKVVELDWQHRRRMESEAKAKVVASILGAKFVQFLSALAVTGSAPRN